MPGLAVSANVLRETVNEYCNTLSKVGSLNGSVLIAYEGEILFSNGFGMANIEHGIPNTPRTIFRIGSITKQFTATAILLLQQSHLIRTGDTVSTYLPDYPNGDKITIHHLLTHTSGIPSFTGFSDYRATMKLPTTPVETVGKFKDLALVFEPGEKYEYSNSGYVLLAYIIEKVTNKSFGDFLDESIFRKLNLRDTGHDNCRKVLPRRASGYSVWGDVRHAEYIDMSVPSGAGALYSTTEDLFLWDQALHSNGFLNPESYAHMTTPDKGNYGYGIVAYEEDINNVKRKVLFHNGGINGFLSDSRHYVDERLTVIVLSNMIPTTQPGNIANALAHFALTGSLEIPKPLIPLDLDSHERAKFTGEYHSDDEHGKTFTISLSEGKLYLTDEDTFKFEVMPLSVDGETTKFFIKGVPGSVTLVGSEIQIEIFGKTYNASK